MSLATVTALAPALLAKAALEDGINHKTGTELVVVIAVFVAAALANWGMTYVETYMTGWVGERILADLRTELFGHLQQLSLGFYERNRAGVLISRMTNDVEAIDQLVTDGVTTLAQSTLLLSGTAVILIVLDWRLALATLVVIPFMTLASAFFRSRSARAYAAVRERLGLVTATLAEDIAGMRMVQAFTREEQATENFRSVARGYRDSNMQTVTLNGIYFPFVSLLATLCLAVVLGYGGHRYFEHPTTAALGTLLAFLILVNNFFDPIQQLSQLYSTFLSATAALDKIIGVLDEPPEVLDHPGARQLPHIEGHVRFEDVHFAYGLYGGEKGEEVLHGIDLDVPAGRRSRSSATREPASRRSRSSSRVSTSRRAAASRSTASTSTTSRRTRCGASSASCRRRASCSPGRWPRTSPSPSRTRARTRSCAPRRPSARTISSCGSRTATRRSSASAAHACRSASASSSRSRAPCSPTRGSSSSTRRRRRSTSGRSGRSSRR